MSSCNNIVADYVLLHGRIYTMDNCNHIYSSIAIKENKIIYLGSSDNVIKYIDDNTIVINLEGKMVLPSFGDSHMHPPGNELIDKCGLDLKKVKGDTNEEIIKGYYNKIIEYANKNKDKSRIYGYGWIPSVFTGIESIKGPKKERLDKLNINKPIILYSYDNHSLWLNSKAFEEFNITTKTSFIDENTPCENVVKGDNGELWGTLKEDAFIFVQPQKFSDDEYIKAFEEFQYKMHSLGITNVASVYVNYMSGFMPYRIYKKLIAEEKLKLRISYSENIHPHIQKEDRFVTYNEQVSNLIKKREEMKETSEYFKVVAGKIFIDGVVDSETAYLSSPYENSKYSEKNNLNNNLWNNKEKSLMYVISELNKNKLQAHFHVIGDNATKLVLDITEKIPSAKREKDRNIITHLQIVRRRDIKRISKLKLIASLQTYWNVKFPNDFEEVEYAKLGERAEYEYPLKSLLDAGVFISGASDYPITDVNPIIGIQRGATRNICEGKSGGYDDIGSIDDDKYLLNKFERLSVKDMIKIYTFNAAYANSIEKDIGSLEINKKADLIILDKDLLKINPLDLHKAKVIATFFDGELVYQ